MDTNAETRTRPVGPPRPVRVVLICNQPLIRYALRLAIEESGSVAVVGEADDLATAIGMSEELGAHVLLVDADAAGEWRRPHEEVEATGPRLVFLASAPSRELVCDVVRAGGVGIVSKSSSVEALRKAVARVHAGEAWFDRSAVADALFEMRRETPAEVGEEAARIASLTAREYEIVRLVSEGLNSRDIAAHLFVSEVTVRHHLTSIFSKLEVPNRKQLMLYAFRNGIAEAPRPASVGTGR